MFYMTKFCKSIQEAVTSSAFYLLMKNNQLYETIKCMANDRVAPVPKHYAMEEYDRGWDKAPCIPDLGTRLK